MTPHELYNRIRNKTTPTVLDVRSPGEFARGRVPGAILAPFWTLLLRAPTSAVRRTDEVVVYCGHGPRAWIAKAALRLRGYKRVTLLEGHWRRWKREHGGPPSSTA